MVPEEIFWVVKNGIKLTGMPAHGESHSDEDLWAIVAFVEQLPLLSPETYQRWSTPPSRPRPRPRESAMTA